MRAKEDGMGWYWSKWWRFATSPSREGIMLDDDGRWVHFVGPIWWLTTRSRTPLPEWCSECNYLGILDRHLPPSSTCPNTGKVARRVGL
jgi:hypothetical protein